MSLLKFFHKTLDWPLLFNFVRHILDGGQIEAVSKILSEIPHHRVVDIACGTGDICQSVDNKKEYVGIDFCESFIEFANRRYGNPNKKFLVMDARKLTLPEKSFDLALIVNAIHHLSDEEVFSMLKQAAVLSKKYILIIDVIPKNNPITKFFLSLDRGEYFRPLEEQKALMSKSGHISLIKESSFESTSRIYRHSVLLGEVVNGAD